MSAGPLFVDSLGLYLGLPAQLMQPHRLLEAPQRGLATVGEDEAFARDQLAHDVGNQHLAALRLRRRPRREDDGRAKEVVVLGDWLARVDADADAQRLYRSP